MRHASTQKWNNDGTTAQILNSGRTDGYFSRIHSATGPAGGHNAGSNAHNSTIDWGRPAQTGHHAKSDTRDASTLRHATHVSQARACDAERLPGGCQRGAANQRGPHAESRFARHASAFGARATDARILQLQGGMCKVAGGRVRIVSTRKRAQRSADDSPGPEAVQAVLAKRMAPLQGLCRTCSSVTADSRMVRAASVYAATVVVLPGLLPPVHAQPKSWWSRQALTTPSAMVPSRLNCSWGGSQAVPGGQRQYRCQTAAHNS